jgi:hypothetical protein
VGQIISVPLQAAGSANSAGDFRVYDPSEIIGETSPHMPAPPPKKNDCGFLGKLIMIVVAIIVTVYAGPEFGLKTAEGFTAANIAAGAAAAATGSIASQIVGNAIGAQDGFSWKAVALAALGGAVGAGVGEFAKGTALGGTGLGATVARAMVSNAISQGIGVVTGLQDKFSWGSVAAAGLGAGVGRAVSEHLGITDPQTGQKTQAFKNLQSGEQFTRSLAVGLAAGAATAIARGGKISAAQVAVDAFGNALGGYFTGEFDSQQEDKLKEVKAAQTLNWQQHQVRVAGMPGSGLSENDYWNSSPYPAGMDDVVPTGPHLDEQDQHLNIRTMELRADDRSGGLVFAAHQQTEKPEKSTEITDDELLAFPTPIHHSITEKTLAEQVSAKDLEIIKSAQGLIDSFAIKLPFADRQLGSGQYQDPQAAFTHGMRGTLPDLADPRWNTDGGHAVLPNDVREAGALTLQIFRANSPSDPYQSSTNPSRAMTEDEARRMANAWVQANHQLAQQAVAGEYPDRDLALRHFGYAVHTLQDAASPSHHGFQPWGIAGSERAQTHVFKEAFSPRINGEASQATRDLYSYFFEVKQLPSGDIFKRYGMDLPPLPPASKEFYGQLSFR